MEWCRTPVVAIEDTVCYSRYCGYMAHLLLQASGRYTPPELQAESWTCTARVALVFGSIDDTGTLPTWSASAADEHTSVTDREVRSNYNISDGANTFSPTDYLEQQGEIAWVNLFAAAASNISFHAEIAELALYPIGSTGHVMEAGAAGTKAVARAVYEHGYPGVRGASVNQLGNPLTVSSCVSWQTKLVGRKGRGRMFLPGVISDCDNGTWAPADQAEFLDAGVAFANSLKLSAAGYNASLIVTGHPWTEYGKVMSVRSGRVPDTQRRRDAQLQEQYLVGPVA